MKRSIFSLLVCGGLIFATLAAPHEIQAQGFSFPAQMNKSFSPLSITPGGISRLQVSVYNPNAFALTNASWTDNLAGVQPGILIANSPNISSTCGGSVTAEPGGTTVSLSGGTVPAQTGAAPGSCTVYVDVTSTTPFNKINTIPAGTLKSTGGGGTVTNTTPASATLHVGAVEGPAINKNFSPNTMLVGQNSQMTIRIRNTDLSQALTQTSIRDSLPDGLVLADPVSSSLSGCGDSASLTADGGSATVTLQNAEIPANATCTMRVNVTSTKSGIYSNTLPAGALKTAQGLTNAAPASAKLNVQDIGLAKSFSPGSFQAGGKTTLTVTLRNSTGSAYTGVKLSDALPGDVLTVVPDTATTTCGGTVTVTPPRTVSLSGGRVPPGTPASPGTCTVSFQVTAPADAAGGDYKNTIPENSLTTDQGITNGQSASDWVRVYPGSGGLSARKSFSPATIPVNENSRLQVNIPAPVDTDLTNFSIVDNLPADVTISNSSPAVVNHCGASAALTAVTGAASFSLAGGTLQAGTTCQVEVYVTSQVPGAHTNVIRPADISNDQNRTIPKEISADLTVQALSDFGIRKSFTPPSVRPGEISTLRITLENRNTVPLVDATVTDPLPGDPANGILVAPTPNAATTCEGGKVTAGPGSQTISLTGGTVPARVNDVPGTCTVTVDVQGMGALTKRTNTIPVKNASAWLQGTDTVLDPTQPATADLVIGELSIGVVKGFDPLTVFGGSASTLSIQLLNPNNVQIDGIGLTDHMPPGMIVADPPNPSVGDCGGTLSVNAGADTFSFSGGSLPAGASCFLKLQVTMTVNGNLTNVIEASTVTSSSGITNPRSAEATLTNLPGASISKSFSPNPIQAGTASQLTFTIRNTGTVSLTGMGFQDQLPGDLPVGLEIVGSPAPVNTCGGTLTAVEGTQLIQLADGALAFNSTCTITVGVTGKVAGDFTNTIGPGQLGSNEGATNHDSTTDTLVVTSGSPDQGGGSSGGGKNSGKKNKPAPTGQAVGGFLIPVTGFAPERRTPLNLSTRPHYDVTSIRLQIPVIGVDTSIVGVQIQDGGWNISWLQNQVGWLNGTAYPTWKGNSVLTGHSVNADGRPGVFSRLKVLDVGEYVYIYFSGYRYAYQVVSNEAVEPDDVSVLQHLDDAYLTLVTCDSYDAQTATYLERVAVRARLMDVRAVP
jgi:LPXTG-site transpeptidase (sortase) family protein